MARKRYQKPNYVPRRRREGWSMPVAPLCECGQPLDPVAELPRLDGWKLYFCCSNEGCRRLGDSRDPIDWPFNVSEDVNAADMTAAGFIVIETDERWLNADE